MKTSNSEIVVSHRSKGILRRQLFKMQYPSDWGIEGGRDASTVARQLGKVSCGLDTYGMALP
jgi:hypothetical protein